MPVLQAKTVSALYVAKTSSAFWKKSLAKYVRWVPFITYCTKSGIRRWYRVPSTVRRIPRHKPLLKKFPEKLQEIACQQPGKRLRVFFQDEVRFGQQGSITRVWAPTGSRPRAVRQTQYDYLWVIGAVCPETGQAEGLLSPRLNIDVINIFLEQFSQTLAEDEHAVMVWDGAGFHRAKHLKVPTNVTLILLPPYSPELNPIENLWHFLKSHHWSNRAYEDFEHLTEAAEQAWKKTCLDNEIMKTVCHASYAKSADFI